MFHIGDSAVFYGKRKLKRRSTIQHTDSGALLQAVGIGDIPPIEYRQFRIQKGTVILLASDGFYKRCEKEICSTAWLKEVVCDEMKIGELLQKIKDRVLALGEKDNISVICIKCGGNSY